jgi:hypothetical protein
MANNNKTIAVDFDGVICQSSYPDLGPLIDGAKEALTVFKALGFTIIISSCRSCSWNWDQYYKGQPVTHASDRKVHQDMVDFLQNNAIPYDVIDDGTKGKVSADYYIDDKGVRFSNNWDDLAFMIHQAEIQERLQKQQNQGAEQRGVAQQGR